VLALWAWRRGWWRRRDGLFDRRRLRALVPSRVAFRLSRVSFLGGGRVSGSWAGSLVHWPAIEVAEHVPRMLTVEAQGLVLEAIPWDLRGAFLAAAYESLRVSEVRAFDCDDYLGDGKLRLAAALQGSRADAKRSHTKNRSASLRELWNPELVRWIEWRLEQFTPEARLRGETALFWNPRAHNPSKRWVPAALRNAWHEACELAGVGHIGLQEGTRHSTLTALGAALPERVLRAYSRHRDARSLDHYAKPQATPDAIVRALRPEPEAYRRPRKP
jgi:hypothetical protein